MDNYLYAIRQLAAVKEMRPRRRLVEQKTRRRVNINRKIQRASILQKPHRTPRHFQRLSKIERPIEITENQSQKELDLEPRRSSPRENRAGDHGARGRGRRSWQGR